MTRIGGNFGKDLGYVWRPENDDSLRPRTGWPERAVGVVGQVWQRFGRRQPRGEWQALVAETMGMLSATRMVLWHVPQPRGIETVVGRQILPSNLSLPLRLEERDSKRGLYVTLFSSGGGTAVAEADALYMYGVGEGPGQVLKKRDIAHVGVLACVRGEVVTGAMFDAERVSADKISRKILGQFATELRLQAEKDRFSERYGETWLTE